MNNIIHHIYLYNNMPNECLNHITITSNDPLVITTIRTLVVSSATIHKCGKKAIRFTYSTVTVPDKDWMNSIVTTYSCWLKNEWIAEDGKAGVWIGTSLSGMKDIKIKQLEWDDVSVEEELYFFTI